MILVRDDRHTHVLLPGVLPAPASRRHDSADRIVVLDDGRVTEQRAHAELMAAGGGYADLYRVRERAYR